MRQLRSRGGAGTHGNQRSGSFGAIIQAHDPGPAIGKILNSAAPGAAAIWANLRYIDTPGQNVNQPVPLQGSLGGEGKIIAIL